MHAVFAEHVADYVNAGLVAFPVDARAKRPLVRNWERAGTNASRAWASNPRFAGAEGIGIRMGGIVEVDVDAAGDAWLQSAVERFGDTPVRIRTASGKGKLWYRGNGEGRRIRPFRGLPIDVLGGGFTIAPPSWREDLGAAYRFLSGSVANLNDLPTIRAGALEDGYTRAAEGVQDGERNNALWRHCMTQARFCDDVEALIDVAASWAGSFPDPLGLVEVERCARSAWRYECEGRNYLGLRKPQITAEDGYMDDLIDQPEALVLYQMFKRWHSKRPNFAIAPTAMSEAGSPPWHRTRIIRARDVLIERGFIQEVSRPIRGRRAGRYRFAEQMADSGKDHYTPSPPG
ncbi:bifunctional DNA primase/polymerase [Tropicimonas isoalkanivorans]|uniref:Primase C terminal 1 (PriCT-1) n=1 Tax=Tropicimonas isoalkanivorans TaxID=441112 RepID=A0A1I1E641_9RHOB|nr:bifunctional DNA primase/polymerase [Tropicimonas isoalkanivorans]SFB82544.1 Primase C terminal 1 (PriCT-1) [Tropicimonas isoalkanivorans]